MSQPWIKVVPLDELDASKVYFIGWRHHDSNERPHYTFYSRYLSGRETWSQKPGIGIRLYGGETLRKDIEKNMAKNDRLDLVAIEVPEDADKRWKARKHPVRRSKY